MITEFKITGLSKPKSFTCETNREMIFWPKSKISKDRFDALWKYIDGRWKDGLIAVIEHDGFYPDGTPVFPVIIEVKQ